MNSPVKRGKLLPVTEGWLACPVCRRNRRLLRVYPDTSGNKIQVFCRLCKSEIIVNIDKGECFQSHGQ